ncbi:MAG: hypothetical protein SXA11_05995 [Cyanobacteriota bacterium]|nr:hypothetical protein [Cyanobacteriota bacterium]
MNLSVLYQRQAIALLTTARFRSILEIAMAYRHRTRAQSMVSDFIK